MKKPKKKVCILKYFRNVKKSVKHLMEESVTKKCVYEQSSNVSALCSDVENCLQLGQYILHQTFKD